MCFERIIEAIISSRIMKTMLKVKGTPCALTSVMNYYMKVHRVHSTGSAQICPFTTSRAIELPWNWIGVGNIDTIRGTV